MHETTSEALETIALSHSGVPHGDEWQCICPCHDDKKGSLYLKLSPDGKLLAHCFAGCSFTDIIKKIRPSKMPGTHTPLAAVKKTPVARYVYRSASGEELFEKLRYEPKTFSIRRKVADGSYIYKGAVADISPELYHADKLQARITAGHVICLCEGEKDADAIIALGIKNVFATTNFEGATGWREQYTAALTGAKILILEDNDPAGTERTQSLILRLASVASVVRVLRFTDLPPKSDVSDFLGAAADKVAAFRERLKSAEVIDLKKTANLWTPPARDSATFEDYVSFMKSLTPDMRRCLLSGKLMAGEHNSLDSCDNMLRFYRSHARQYGKFFSLTAFEDHLSRLEAETTAELLVHIPEWDGVDRLRQATDIFKIKNVTNEEFYQLMLYWGSTMFRRLDDETIQPITPIFQGPQGCGKDAFIEALVGGLSHYRKDLSFATDYDIREALKKLHTALVFVISEFDRVAKVNQGFLKSILNRAYTDERLSYDRADKQRKVRCSFIASCNQKNVLVDAGANRRFWYFEFESMGLELVTNAIGKTQGTGRVLQSYPGLFGRPEQKAEQAQLLAQFQHFARANYRPEETVLDNITQQMLDLTPESLEEYLLADWDSALAELDTTCDSRIGFTPYYKKGKIDFILELLIKRYGVKLKWVFGVLKREGRSSHDRQGTLYCGAQVTEASDAKLIF